VLFLNPPTGSSSIQRSDIPLNFTKLYKSQRSALRNAIILFILVSGLLIAVDQLSILCGLQGSLRIADDLLGGLVAGSIFHSYERHRLRRFSEHLHLIDLTNHHIRNALQPLMFVSYGSEGNAQMKVIEDCVHRIDWVLREVLPGESEESSVVHTCASARRIGLTAGSREASSLSEHNQSRQEPANQCSKPFFSQWLDAWRSRNQKAS
jgi:hypothetical protein